MTRGRSIVLVGVLAGFLSGSVSALASAETYTFGSNLQQPPSPGYYDACSETCTSAQLVLPGAQVTSPVSGTVVRFRLRTAAGSDPQKIKFRILRSTDGERFTGVGTSRAFDIPTTEGIATFDVNMPIRHGDFIGIDQPGDGKRANVIAVNNGAFQAAWFPALGDNVTPKGSDNARGTAPTVFELLLQADVESKQAVCTNDKMVATCPDTDGFPSMCSPKTADYPQCSMPTSLPTQCGPTGLGFQACNLPGNHIVACGGLGLTLPVCDLPPKEVPGVCGPVTLGFQPCTVSNNQVVACGPVSAGLPQCNFKGPIPGRAPIEPAGGELDTKVACPPAVEGPSEADCRVYVAIAPLIRAKADALYQLMQQLFGWWSYGWAWVPEEKRGGESLDQIKEYAEFNASVFFHRRALPLIHPSNFPYRMKVPLQRMTSAERENYEIFILQRGTANFEYRGPLETSFNPHTQYAAGRFVDAISRAVDELVTIAKAKGRGASAGGRAEASQENGARLARPVFKDSFRIKRSKRKGERIRIKLSKKAARKLIKSVPKKVNVAPVRMVVSFEANPRPIVRFVDFGLKIKR